MMREKSELGGEGARAAKQGKLFCDKDKTLLLITTSHIDGQWEWDGNGSEIVQ
jgi:hypothetical protein